MLSSARRAFLSRASFRLSHHPSSPAGVAPWLAAMRRPGSAYLPGPTAYARHVAVALLSGFVATGVYHFSVSPAGSAENSNGSSGQSPSVRTALVVDNGNLYTGPLPDRFPVIKEVGGSGRRVYEMITPDQATAILRRNEQSWLVERDSGVARYDFVQIASNDPIEDDHSETFMHIPAAGADQPASPATDWMFWGIYDGHSGWSTSATLREQLIPYVARELNTTVQDLKALGSVVPSPEAIDTAIKKGFVQLDYDIVYESVRKVLNTQSKLVSAQMLGPALAGSCALLSFYDSQSKLLRVACTGDSRAVLGRRSADGRWSVIPLSEDQTGDTPSEVQRLRQEHPGEPDVVRSGRVLGGLQPTRAFGDATYKWDTKTREWLRRGFYGADARGAVKTPPYVTAEPVVTTTKIQPENGDFVIMATDGLWEMLTNEEAIGLVGQWLDAKERGFTTSQSWLGGWFSGSKKTDLPVEPTDEHGKKMVRPRQWYISDRFDKFTVEDRNAATHLARNAMGGKDLDQLCSLLTLQSPMSRRFRDDLTIQVIFFGDQSGSGDVRLNTEASAKIQSKL